MADERTRRSNVKIELPNITSIDGRLIIDGVEMKGVRKFSLSAGVDEINILRIEMVADGVSVDGNANVREVTPFNAEYRKYIRGKDGVEEAAQ